MTIKLYNITLIEKRPSALMCYGTLSTLQTYSALKTSQPFRPFSILDYQNLSNPLDGHDCEL